MENKNPVPAIFLFSSLIVLVAVSASLLVGGIWLVIPGLLITMFVVFVVIGVLGARKSRKFSKQSEERMRQLHEYFAQKRNELEKERGKKYVRRDLEQ